jgi:hypothetical protein
MSATDEAERQTKGGSAQRTPPPRRWRQRLFRGLLVVHLFASALVVAVLGFAIVETRSALSVGEHFGPFFVVDGEHYRAAAVTMPPSSFLRDKPDGVFRVFVLGGSAAMGSPYVVQTRGAGDELFGLLRIPNQGGIASWAEDWLGSLGSEPRVEVVNAAMGGRDLASSRELHAEILNIGQPDLVVLLSGNNERDSQALVGGFELAPGRDLDEEVARLQGRFAASLDLMIERSQQADVPLWILTVPSNLRDWEPVDRPLPEHQRASTWVEAGDPERCIRDLMAAEPGTNARSAYLLGVCLEARGTRAAAAEWFRVARDRDRAFLRVRSPWNDVVRARAGRPMARVLDAEAWVEDLAHPGVPGGEQFGDACHMRLATNRAVGRLLAEAIATELLGVDPQALSRLAVPDPAPELLRRLAWLQRVKRARLELAVWLQGAWRGGDQRQRLELELQQVELLEEAWSEGQP